MVLHRFDDRHIGLTTSRNARADLFIKQHQTEDFAMKMFATAFLLVLSLCADEALACTTFCLKGKGEVLFGRNYDWMIGDALLTVNKRGVSKVATGEMAAAQNTAKWVSKYGSVTFNQYGRENPTGGMNEAGLVVELMWLDETQWPKANNRPVVGTLEWIQYQLDTSATVDDVIKNSDKVRIASDVKVHYLVNDKAGNSAAIEYINGALTMHSGDKLPVPALANDTYDKSLAYSKTKSADEAKSERSLDRFTRAAKSVKEFEAQPKTEQQAIDYAFSTLADVAQKGYTQWSIVYDQQRGKIYFRTLKNSNLRSVDTKSFDYSCGSAVKIYDLSTADSGDITAKFGDYNVAANRGLIERSFTGTPFLKSVPAGARDILAAYPDSFTCSLPAEKIPAQKGNKDSIGLSLLTPPIFYFIDLLMG
jgi:choloylglycine hydrolase